MAEYKGILNPVPKNRGGVRELFYNGTRNRNVSRRKHFI